MQKDNRVKIQLKADDVQLVKSEVGSDNKGPKTGFLTLDNDEEFTEKVEKAKPVQEDEMFNANDLATLDV